MSLITLTGPSASGKNFVLEELVKNHGFEKLVSTTTRAPRAGEKDGEDYFFISRETSDQMLLDGKFAEAVIFNDHRYAITNEEMDRKLASGKPVAIILTPEGVMIYEALAKHRRVKVLKVFIDTPEKIRVERLKARLAQQVFGNGDRSAVKNFISEFADRITVALRYERSWIAAVDYDLAIPGTDLDKAVELIQIAL